MAGPLGIVKCPPEVLDLGRAVGMAASPATIAFTGTSTENREITGWNKMGVLPGEYDTGREGQGYIAKGEMTMMDHRTLTR